MQAASFNPYSKTQCLLQFPYLHKPENASTSTTPQSFTTKAEIIMGTIIKGSHEGSCSESAQPLTPFSKKFWFYLFYYIKWKFPAHENNSPAYKQLLK